MHFPIICLYLTSLIAIFASHTFQGHFVSDEDWEKKVNTVKCFAENGTWVPYKYGLTPLRSTAHCHSSPYSKMKCASSKGNKYDWYTGSRCDSPKHYFSAERMCELMNGKAFGIVGDSMQEVLAHSFMTDMYGSAGYTSCWVCQMACFGWHYFDCESLSKAHNQKYNADVDFVPVHWSNFSITHIRNDKLYVGGRIDPGYNSKFMLDWTRQLYNQWLNYTVIVLNRGAHYETNDTVFINDVNITFSFLSSNFPRITVLYRATSPGHADVEKLFYAAPLKAPQSFNLTNAEYHYADFERQNLLVRNLIEKHYPNYIYLNIYPMMLLRADSHRDPLHYCIPGPTSAWSDLIFQTLHMFNSPESSRVRLREYEVLPSSDQP